VRFACSFWFCQFFSFKEARVGDVSFNIRDRYSGQRSRGKIGKGSLHSLQRRLCGIVRTTVLCERGISHFGLAHGGVTQPKGSSYNVHGCQLHGPSSKGTKLLCQVIKAIINEKILFVIETKNTCDDWQCKHEHTQTCTNTHSTNTRRHPRIGLQTCIFESNHVYIDLFEVLMDSLSIHQWHHRLKKWITSYIRRLLDY